jgi:hypothetical protein
MSSDAALFRRAIIAQLAEYAFVALPLVVIIVAAPLAHGSLLEVFASPEWSFGTAILFGQTVARVGTAAGRGAGYHWEHTFALEAGLIVFGLVPSLVLLVYMVGHHTVAAPPAAIWQLVFFLVASASFILIGAAGHYSVERRRDAQLRQGAPS